MSGTTMPLLRIALAVAAQLAAGFVGGFLGGLVIGFIETVGGGAVAPGLAWLVPLAILLTFIGLGALLGRWRHGPTRREVVAGCLLYVVVNVLLDVAETGGARLLLRVIMGGIGAAAFFAAAAWGLRRRRVRP